jgi:ABC-2 type transport system permease protein
VIAPALAQRARLLRATSLFELRRATAFRAGFVVQQLVHGLARPAVMIFVYASILNTGATESLRGWTFPDLVRYLILAALFDKVVFRDRLLDLSEQIFQGRVTKALVMPFSYFYLPVGRFVQHAVVQLPLVAVLFALGAWALPEWWPALPRASAVPEALVLLLLGSWCTFLTYVIVHQLAFWLDVVWSLQVMVRFASMVVAGLILPVSIMPDAMQSVFHWAYPYWTICAPIELWLGRLEHAQFLRGLAVLGVSALLLGRLRAVLWRRGLRRYTGSGM